MLSNTALKVAPQLIEIPRKELQKFLTISRKGKELCLATITLETIDGFFWATCQGRKVSTKIRLGKFGQNPLHPISVPLKDLLNALKSGKTETSFLFWDEVCLTIYLGDSKIHIKAVEGYTLPFLSVNQFTMPSQSILEIFPAMLKVIDNESPRAYGTVLSFSMGEWFLEFCGTNGFWLVVAKTMDIPELAKSLHGIMVPRDGVETLFEMAKLSSEISIGISEDKATLMVNTGNFYAEILTSSVKFPNYKVVIPETKTGLPFDRKELLAVFQAALKTTDKSRQFNLSESWIEIRKLENEDFSTYKMEGLSVPFPISLNGKYLADCLSASKEENGLICFGKDSEEPIKIILGGVETVIVPIKKG